MSPWRRPILTVCAGLGFVVLVCLGSWQLQRLAWKRDLIADVEARTTAAPVSLTEILALPEDERRYRPVAIEAVAMGDRLAHVAGTYEGVSGFYVFSAVEVPSGGLVAVNHGFVPFDARDPGRYDLALPGPLTGLYRESVAPRGLSGTLTPPPDLAAGTFYARDPEGLLAWLLGAAPPSGAFYLDRDDNAGPDALPRGGTSRVVFSNRHLSYALTWFGLAAGLFGVYIVLLRQRSSRARENDRSA